MAPQHLSPCKIGARASTGVSGFTTKARGHWENRKQYPNDNDNCVQKWWGGETCELIKFICRTLTGKRESSERFPSYNQEIFMVISGAKCDHTNKIKKRKEGTPEIKEASL